MTRAARTSLALFAALGSIVLASCETIARCPVPGVTTSCVCPGGASGARVCGDDNVWRTCDCSGAIGLPEPISIAPPSGTGGTSGGTAAPTGGTSVVPDDDAGVDPIPGTDAGPTGGSGGSGATGGTAGSGGVGATGGTGGTAGTDATPPDPYRPCMANTDCDTGGACVVTPGFVTLSVCAPACVDVGDCPVPAGTYEASVVCDVGYCKVDCTPLPFAPLLTCPTGMTCVVPLFGISHCHDDGV